MNREQKSAVIDEIAGQITEADAVFAVDYRGISVPQAAELRSQLREADASFRVVKNSLTERAADKAGAEGLRVLLQGPTAFTFVHGDAAMAAKALNDFGRRSGGLLPFKGGLLDGKPLTPEELQAIARLPSRDVLHAQLVGTVAAPLTGLVRGLASLLGGVAVALGQVLEKKESGELPAGDAPAEAEPAPSTGAADPAEAAAADGGEATTEGAEAQAAETEAAPAEGAETSTEQDAPEQDSHSDETGGDDAAEDKE
jgi:large subunit ribosomal protein L10